MFEMVICPDATLDTLRYSKPPSKPNWDASSELAAAASSSAAVQPRCYAAMQTQAVMHLKLHMSCSVCIGNIGNIGNKKSVCIVGWCLQRLHATSSGCCGGNDMPVAAAARLKVES